MFFFCATSRNTFALFARHLSLTEDYLSSVSCQYFTAVGGESSPFPDDTPVCFKTKPLLRDHRCMSPSGNRYQHRIHLKGQCGCTMAIREHLGRVSLGQSWTGFCSSEKVSFDLVPKWTAVLQTHEHWVEKKKKEKSIKRWQNCQMALFSSTSSP